MSVIKQLLSLNKNSADNQISGDKIELLACNTGAQNCKEHLLIINKCYVEAHSYHLEKDYLNTIESLKCAYYKTCDLKEENCIKCAEFFRSTITQSIENLNGELESLTSGITANKRYLSSYNKSSNFLQDIRKKF
jgi:hypothetical protein